eukprot:SAG31_NODE_4076_length_3611_cov_1.957005_1_plen_182_part_00
MSETNAALALLLGSAQLVGGDTFSALWWLCPATSARERVCFITLASDPAAPTVTRAIITLGRFLTLPSNQQYRLLMWDGVASLAALSPSVDSRSLQGRRVDIGLGPGETKLLCFAPTATAAELLGWASDESTRPDKQGRVRARFRARCSSLLVVVVVVCFVCAAVLHHGRAWTARLCDAEV